MKTFMFTIQVVGKGMDIDEAWDDVLDGFIFEDLDGNNLLPELLEEDEENYDYDTPDYIAIRKINDELKHSNIQ
jgi:hypothetical protein